PLEMRVAMVISLSILPSGLALVTNSHLKTARLYSTNCVWHRRVAPLIIMASLTKRSKRTWAFSGHVLNLTIPEHRGFGRTGSLRPRTARRILTLLLIAIRVK